jgi:hypothetical protein
MFAAREFLTAIGYAALGAKTAAIILLGGRP